MMADETVARLNIEDLRRLLATEEDPGKQKLLLQRLSEEEQKLAEALRRKDNRITRFQCATKGVGVQALLASMLDPEETGTRNYQPINCPACAGLHFIDTETRKLKDSNRTPTISRPATRANASVGRRFAVWCPISPSQSPCVGTEK